MTPAGAEARAAAPARTGAPARRPIAPRRVSGPARRPSRPPPAAPPLAPRLRRLVDHPFLDRLISGRTWIGIIAFALIGIVGMQVALLKLNAGIGRSVERAAALQRENSLFTAQISTLRAGDLQRAATAQQGMVYAPPGDVRYLTAAQGDAARAAASITPPAALGGTSTGPGRPTSGSSQTSSSSPAGSTTPTQATGVNSGPSTSAIQASATPSGGSSAASAAPSAAGGGG